MLIYLLGFAFFMQQVLFSSEEFDNASQNQPSLKSTLSFMTHQEVENRLSLGLFPSSKLRIRLALAPATQEYLTEEFIAIVQRFFQKTNIYEKCYVIRAVMKLPVAHLTTLNNLATEHAQQLINIPSTECVSFLKKLREKEPDQWQAEIMRVLSKYQK